MGLLCGESCIILTSTVQYCYSIDFLTLPMCDFVALVYYILCSFCQLKHLLITIVIILIKGINIKFHHWILNILLIKGDYFLKGLLKSENTVLQICFGLFTHLREFVQLCYKHDIDVALCSSDLWCYFCCHL